MRTRMLLAGIIKFAPACATHDAVPPGDPVEDACGGYDGLGTVDVGSGFTPVNAWAFYGASPVMLGATDAVGLQVVLSTDASLSCATGVAAFASGQVQAYVMSAVPPGNAAVTPGDYEVQGSAAQAAPSSADIDFLFCSGGQFNSCGFSQPQSGSITLDTVASPVTGAFSVTFQGQDPQSGNFCAPFCDPSG